MTAGGALHSHCCCFSHVDDNVDLDEDRGGENDDVSPVVLTRTFKLYWLTLNRVSLKGLALDDAAASIQTALRSERSRAPGPSSDSSLSSLSLSSSPIAVQTSGTPVVVSPPKIPPIVSPGSLSV